MENNEFKNLFHFLRGISDVDSDILNSEALGEKLAGSDSAKREAHTGNLLRMQLAAAQLHRFMREHDDKDFQKLSMEEKLPVCVRFILEDKLSCYSAHERRAIMLQMIQTVLNQQDENKDDVRKNLELNASTDEELFGQLSDSVIEQFYRIMASDGMANAFEKAETLEAVDSADFSESAWAGAIYATDTELQAVPETIGTAAAAIAETQSLFAPGIPEDDLLEKILLGAVQVCLTLIIDVFLAGALSACACDVVDSFSTSPAETGFGMLFAKFIRTASPTLAFLSVITSAAALLFGVRRLYRKHKAANNQYQPDSSMAGTVYSVDPEPDSCEEDAETNAEDDEEEEPEHEDGE